MPDKYLNDALISFLKDMKVEAILGIDFFMKRDVYIDYEKQEVWATEDKESKRDDDLKELGFKHVWAIPWKGYIATTLLLKRLPTQIIFPLLDTGAMQTSLPDSFAPAPKPEGAKESRILGFEGLLTGWIHREAGFTFADNSEHEIPIHFVNTEVPVVAPRDLGSQALFQFRRNKVWFK